MRAQLIPLDGGTPFEIVKDLTLVGRKEDCDVRLDHKSVSKHHCIIARTDGLLVLRDLGSTNGTRVNNQRIRRAVLMPNDQLSIANYKFRVYLGPDLPEKPNLGGEHTQQLDSHEVADLMRQVKGRPVETVEEPVEPVHPNPLPDAYPDDDSSE